jgi:hypothetical protein
MTLTIFVALFTHFVTLFRHCNVCREVGGAQSTHISILRYHSQDHNGSKIRTHLHFVPLFTAGGGSSIYFEDWQRSSSLQ